MRTTTLCVFVSTALLAVILYSQEARAQQTTAGQPLVLKGATVIDGFGRAPVPDAVIVIEGNKVKSVGGKATPYPSDAAVLDLSGKFVVPGLVDMHVHYRPWLGELFLNYGVTSIAVPGNPDYEAADRDVSNKPEVRSPRIFSTSGRPLVTANMTREQVRDAVREWLKKKPDYAALPVFNERSAQVYQWTTEMAHEAGLMVFGHTENAPDSVRVGQDIVEHMWGFA